MKKAATIALLVVGILVVSSCASKKKCPAYSHVQNKEVKANS
jgi:PBP1b-binding outer membrane lipoprotein LpoB